MSATEDAMNNVEDKSPNLDDDTPVQYFSQLEPFTDFEDVYQSTISPTLTPIEYPAAPTPFQWPAHLPTYIDALYSQHFHLRSRRQNPYFFTNGTMGHLGRDSYEVYARRLPNHPVKPEPNDSTPHPTTHMPDWHPLFKAIYAHKHPGKEHEYPGQPKLATHSAFPTEKDSVVVVAWFHAGPFACGPPGLVHGGLLSAIADTLMYETVLESERKAVTASLNMAFKSPTPINSLILIIASVELTGDRKAHARCALFNEDLSVVHVEGQAVFVTPTAWVGLKEDLTYGVKKITKFDNTKTVDVEKAKGE